MDKDLARPGTVAPLVVPEIVTFPDEIDITNADRYGTELAAALRQGVAVVIADLTLTTFADSTALRILLTAHHRAAAGGAELRIVIPSAQVLRTFQLTGLDRLLHIYPSLGTALTSGPSSAQA